MIFIRIIQPVLWIVVFWSIAFSAVLLADDRDAIDIGDRSQPPVWAAGGGKVIKVVNNCDRVSYGCGGGYGNNVIVDHGNGLKTLYAHLEYTSVSVGDQVAQGTVLGKMGRSGNVRGATGIHLHFEVQLNGKKEVPGDYY